MHYVRIEGGYALRERKKMICLNCGKKLKDAKSIERGYGPVCWGKVAGAMQQILAPLARTDAAPSGPDYQTRDRR